MLSSLLLFLVVFVVLSLARTKIDSEIAHRKTACEIHKLINIFFTITGTIIVVALILVIMSFILPGGSWLSPLATALLLAVIISLITRGALQDNQT